jgi:hypothetical protein
VLEEHVLLGWEVQVEGAPGDAGAADDVLYLGRADPDAPELPHGRLEDTLTGLEPLPRPKWYGLDHLLSARRPHRRAEYVE